MVTSKNKIILSSGRFDGTSRQQLVVAFDSLIASQQKNNLLIYFHGGLVPQSNAEKTAERLLPIFQRAGAYPLFVIWKSGLDESIKNNWKEIIKEDVFPILVNRVLQFILGKLDQRPGEMGLGVALPDNSDVETEIKVKRAAKEEPFANRNAETAHLEAQLSPAEEAQFKKLLSNDRALFKASTKLNRDDAPELTPALTDELNQANDAAPGEKSLITTATMIAAGVRILGRALFRLSTHRDHGIYTTVVEEVVRELKGDLLGGIVWKHMKKDTLDSFEKDGSTYGGTAILEEIKRIWQAGHKPRIMLVGHSAGTVYICNFLQKAEKFLPPDVKFEVVFLAAACSFDLLDGSISAVGKRISAFNTFGLADDLEKTDAILSPVYMYSLPYFVSGVLEVSPDLPLVGMQRYYNPPYNTAAFGEIARVQAFLKKSRNKIIWSKPDGTDPATRATTHGGFTEDEITLNSIARLIKP